MTEALIFASTNPQYDSRLFFESPVQYMKIPSSEHVVYTNCFFVFVLIFRTILSTQHVLSLEFSCTDLWTGDSMNNLLSYCGLSSWGKNKCFWKRFTCTSLNMQALLKWTMQALLKWTRKGLSGFEMDFFRVFKFSLG